MLYVEKIENKNLIKFVKINVEKENLLYESLGRYPGWRFTARNTSSVDTWHSRDVVSIVQHKFGAAKKS